MRKVLVPIDAHAEARSRAALDEAIALYLEEPVEIHLLNVQIPVSGHVAMFFDIDALHANQRECGKEELAPAQARLAAAGIPCKTHVSIGRSAESIARSARQLGCDRILMGQGHGFGDRLFGTLAGQVRHLVGASGIHCTVTGA